MDNENKETVEVKKKGNGLFTLFACVMTGIIVFLATNLGYKASKVVEPDTNSGSKTTSNVESNTTSNVESNTTSNVESNITSNVTSNTTTSNAPVATKLTDAEALTKGNELYKSAREKYNDFLSGVGCGNSDSQGLSDCTSLYNTLKTVFADDNKTGISTGNVKENIFKKFTAKNGKYYYMVGGIGFNGTTKTTLTVKNIEENKISYTATTVFTYYGENKTETKEADFIIVKENNTWKVSDYTFTW